jgi:hypothetical protein
VEPVVPVVPAAQVISAITENPVISEKEAVEVRLVTLVLVPAN